MPLAPGVKVDRYTLVEHLGGGGQADVWRADDPLHPDEPRAIKLVSTRLAKSAALERVRREARLLSGLHHPSLCRIHGLFEDLDQEVLGLVMDHVPGTSLAVALADERLDQPARIHVLLHLARALAHVHAAGAVHRDVKLDNIILSQTFFVRPADPKTLKLVDFGVASTDDAATTLTSEGHVVGTAAAMAPEQLEPHHYGVDRPGPPADLFAFGVVAWQLLIGGHPTRLPPTATIGDFIAAYRTAESSGDWPPRAPSSTALMRVVRKCLALHPEDRYAHAGIMLAGLTEALEEPEPEKKGTPVHGGPEKPRPPPVAAVAESSSRGGRSTARLAASGCGLLLLGALVTAGWWGLSHEDDANDVTPDTPSARPSPAPPAPAPKVVITPQPRYLPTSCDRGASFCECCPTKRDCGGSCDRTIGDDDVFVLRLWALNEVVGGETRHMANAHARVGLAGGRQRRMTPNGRAGIRVTGKDLRTKGLDIDVVQSGKVIVDWNGARHTEPQTRIRLCKGLPFNFHFTKGYATKPMVTKANLSGLIAFYLDPIEGPPLPRCP
ncbi:MAG: serine/threonine-protein kinase [Polyangiaceae bacterium]